MTDYIKREDAIKAVIADAKLKNLLTGNCENGKAIEGMVYEVLCPRDVPSADVVEADKVNKIYEKLADLLGIPCNYSPCDEIMLENERCREDCGDIPEAECWRRYFEVVCE